MGAAPCGGVGDGREDEVENDGVGESLHAGCCHEEHCRQQQQVAQQVVADTEILEFQREHAHIAHHQQRHTHYHRRHDGVAQIDVLVHPLHAVRLHPGGGADPEDGVGGNGHTLEFGGLRVIEVETRQAKRTHGRDEKRHKWYPPRAGPYLQAVVHQH